MTAKEFRVTAIITPEGIPAVLTETPLPPGATAFMLSPSEAIGLGFTILNVAGQLFRTAKELEDAVLTWKNIMAVPLPRHDEKRPLQ